MVRLRTRTQSNPGAVMRTNRGWIWAYRKARGWNCSWLHSTLTATRYFINGDTGNFNAPSGAIYRLRY